MSWTRLSARAGGGNSVSVAVRLDEAIKAIDKVTSGAASGFRRIVTEELRPVEIGARKLWPRRTGRSADAIKITTEIKGDRLYVSLVSTARYARWVKFSRYTEAEMRALPDVAEKAARGNTPEAKRRIEDFFLRRMRSRHGMGAPSPELAGKYALTTLMRKPAAKLRGRIVERAADDIARLAGTA